MADTKISALSAVTSALSTDEFVLARSGTTKKIDASDLAVSLSASSELDYVERTTNLTVTATTAAGANTFITGNSVAYDGSTRICIEVYAPTADVTQFCDLTIWDGSTDLGAIFDRGAAGSGTVFGRRFLTPSAASHTYTIKAYRGTGSATVYGGNGGTGGQYLPAYLRITTA